MEEKENIAKDLHDNYHYYNAESLCWRNEECACHDVQDILEVTTHL